MKNNRFLIIISVFLSSGQSQVDADLNVQSGYYSNVFNSVVSGSQKYIYVDGLLKVPITQSLNAYGGLDGVFYNPTTSYSNYSAESGLFGFKQINDMAMVNGGLYFSTDQYESTFNYYNSRNFGGYINLIYFINSRLNAKFGYSLEKSNYDDLDGVNNIDHQLSIKMIRSFDSGSAIMGYSSFGIQKFDSFSPQASADGAGRNITETQQFDSNSTFNLRLRVSHSITEKAGIALTVEHKEILALNSDILFFDQYFYNPLQDRFQWQGEQIDLKMTLVPKHDIHITGTTTFRTRTYDNNPVYDYDIGSETYKLENGNYVLLENMRVDENATLEMSVEKIWFKDIYEFEKGLGLNLTIGYGLNLSNDPIYNSSGIYSFLSFQYYY
ncbi:MAG: hypothetical protein ISR82_03995 [Candidatus Marinimicrobia bacterium]|nr:hypothetical protein [Candidatus Neomarinimicrobiota bacterium]MBL7010363.1 hypothetical protein [Candidatus Neomarinimicrobiota bacterium]MBL7030754.1 hypothetical protein [Candidatus Neomarinimicrobiota bacterium]